MRESSISKKTGAGALPDSRSRRASGRPRASLVRATHQVFLARKFYNDVVALTRDARNRPLARLLRLSGNAPAPVFFEMDDSLIADKPGAPLGSAFS